MVNPCTYCATKRYLTKEIIRITCVEAPEVVETSPQFLELIEPLLASKNVKILLYYGSTVAVALIRPQ